MNGARILSELLYRFRKDGSFFVYLSPFSSKLELPKLDGGGCLMRMADWLTYTSMEQLRQLNLTYHGEELVTHSKHDLIRSLLPKLCGRGNYQTQLTQLRDSEYRFLQLLIFDTSSSFTMEELIAKGRAALCRESAEPRTLVVKAIKKGWLFQGYSHQTQYLYHVPTDTKKLIQNCLLDSYGEFAMVRPPSCYRDEEQQIIRDLQYFLQFLRKHVVRTTEGGAIYRNQLRQLIDTFVVSEDLVAGKGPRFGFGRSYHLYPDRFSLIYDFAFYHGYFTEDPEGYLRLSEQNFGKVTITDREEQVYSLYRFWIRLYKRPIPNLPIILKWIGSLAQLGWFPVATVFEVVSPWLIPFYYETEDTLFHRLINMLVHLGVIRVGEEAGLSYLTLTSLGVRTVIDVSAFREKEIEDAFVQGRD
jgi:hypothetical protein